MEFSCRSISEAQLTFSLDQKWLLDQPEINGHAKLGHCIVVPVLTVKKLLVVLGQSKVSCLSAFSASINGHVVCISGRGRVHHRGFADLRGVYTPGGQSFSYFYLSGPEKRSTVPTIKGNKALLKAHLQVTNKNAVLFVFASPSKA